MTRQDAINTRGFTIMRLKRCNLSPRRTVDNVCGARNRIAGSSHSPEQINIIDWRLPCVRTCNHERHILLRRPRIIVHIIRKKEKRASHSLNFGTTVRTRRDIGGSRWNRATPKRAFASDPP
ncbi:uncharacterized protein LOC122396525 [Colletes gigas]|uniref:uncharacterized protein LOC122396525 n=1 Tax=Colletes gigas TaxID=935657 RepID=UPI001C9A3B9D|nr:uncharacterized protein LOC122396525 [Colletes gigas]